MWLGEVYWPMKRSMVSLVLLSGVLAGVGCESPSLNTSTTTIKVVGPQGSKVSGYYIQNGYRYPFTGALPLGLAHDGLSEFEVLKEHPDQTLILGAQTDDRGWHWEAINHAGEGVRGLRVIVDDGLAIDRLK